MYFLWSIRKKPYISDDSFTIENIGQLIPSYIYISKHLFGLTIFTYLSSTSLLLLGATKSAINQQLYCRHVLSKKGPKMGPHELKIGIKFDLVVFEGVEKYTVMQPY